MKKKPARPESKIVVRAAGDLPKLHTVPTLESALRAIGSEVYNFEPGMLVEIPGWRRWWKPWTWRLFDRFRKPKLVGPIFEITDVDRENGIVTFDHASKEP